MLGRDIPRCASLRRVLLAALTLTFGPTLDAQGVCEGERDRRGGAPTSQYDVMSDTTRVAATIRMRTTALSDDVYELELQARHVGLRSDSVAAVSLRLTGVRIFGSKTTASTPMLRDSVFLAVLIDESLRYRWQAGRVDRRETDDMWVGRRSLDETVLNAPSVELLRIGSASSVLFEVQGTRQAIIPRDLNAWKGVLQWAECPATRLQPGTRPR